LAQTRVAARSTAPALSASARQPAGMTSTSNADHAIEEAITTIRPCLGRGGAVAAEAAAGLTARLCELAETSPELRRVLERHGWTASALSWRGGSGYFRSTPVWDRLLRDLESAGDSRVVESHYVIDEVAVGEGSYGAVYKARDSRTQQTVAIKRVKTEQEEGVPSTSIREVAVLKAAEHRNIVKLIDVYCTPGRLDLVFEFVPVNLRQHMRSHNLRLELKAVRSLTHQLLLGIDFCHSRRILHRDLKPANILISAGTSDGDGLLKIADFGMARAFCVPVPRYTHEVVTIWYRPPEILLGGQEYSLPVDVWSAGCIVGEMATGAVLFRGESEIDTIFQIFRKLGTPTEATFPQAVFPDFKLTFPKWRRQSWEDIRGISGRLGAAGTQLIDEMLRYEPPQRISAKRALTSPFFSATGACTPRGTADAASEQQVFAD